MRLPNNDPIQVSAVVHGKPTLHALTSLRIFAAVHVVFSHFAGSLLMRDLETWDPSATTPVPLVQRVIHYAQLAAYNLLNAASASVSLFFVLSGFILAYNYIDSTAKRQTSPGQFWAARIARVYPVYLLAWLIALPSAITHLHGAPPVKQALLPLMSVTATHGWVPAWALDWNSPSWSLCCEGLFYVLFPLVFYRAMRETRPQAGRHRLLAEVIFWLAATVLIPSVYVLLQHGGVMPVDTEDSLELAPWLRTLAYAPLVRVPEFLGGVALGRLFLLDRFEHRRAPYWLSGAALALVLVVLSSGLLPRSFTLGSGAAPMFALLIFGLAHQGALSGALNNGALIVLGEASYAMYILHVPLAGWYRLIARKLVPSLFAGLSGEDARTPSWGYFLVYFVLVLAASLLSFKFFETPARNWVRGLLDRKRRAPQAASIPVPSPRAT